MKKIILSLLCTALACVSHAQSVGQYSINKKVNATGPLTAQHWTGSIDSLWGQDGSGNPVAYVLGANLSFVGGELVASGGGLTNVASTISGDTLTLAGALTAGRTLTIRDLAGTVALTSDLSAYQTSLTTGTFGLDLLAAADQAAAQTLLSLGNAAYATATSTEGSPTYVSYANHTHALAGSYLTGTLPISKGGTSTTTAPAAGKLMIGTSGGTYNVATLTAGTGVTVTNGSGSITLAVNQAALTLTSIGGTLSVAKGGTGITSFGTGVATWLVTPSSDNLATAITDETGSGALVFGTSPTLTTPAFSGAISMPDGVRQTFNPDGTEAGLNVGAQAGDPSSLTDGDVWYNSSAGVLRARINGTTKSIPGGSKVLLATATASSSTEVLFDNLVTANYDSYEVQCVGVKPSVDGAGLKLILRTPTPANILDSYKQNGCYVDLNSSTGVSSTGAEVASSGWVINNMGNDTTEYSSVHWSVDLMSGWCQGKWDCVLIDPGSGMYGISYYGAVQLTQTVAGFRIYFTAGNIAEGKFRLYGIRNN